MNNLVGQKLGKYRLVKLLDRGGFAHVFLGEHILLGSQAAIKVLSTKITDTEAGKFLSEARNIASLNHRHIIRVLDYDITEDGTPFLIMEYAPNGSLARHRPKGVALPRITVVSYIKQVASALQYAHDQKKMIHRDVKPANMLLNSNNEVVLSDFGIAVIAQSSQNKSGQQEMIGTINYMAPEQIQGNPCLASDQYALGIVAYEWLSGDRPFQGTHIEIGTQHMLVQPPSLTGKVPPLVEQVVMQALNKDPRQRFPRIQDFADALEDSFQQAQKVTYSLSDAAQTEENTYSNKIRDIVPLPQNPFEESWATANALVSHYQQIIENYYESANNYEQAENELQHDFILEQQTIREAWVNGYTHAEGILNQVRQELDITQRWLEKSRWRRLINKDVSPQSLLYGNTDAASDLEKYRSIVVETKRDIIKIIKQHSRSKKSAYISGLVLGVLLVVTLWIVFALSKLPGVLIFFSCIALIIIIRRHFLEKLTNNVRVLYASIVQLRDTTEVTYQQHLVSLQHSYQGARDRSQKQYDQSIATITNVLEEEMTKLRTILAICAQEAGLLVSEWDDPHWEQWQPFNVTTPIVRVGKWRVVGPRELPPIPALAVNSGLENILIESDGTGKNAALAAIQSVMLRLLATHPPGGLRFILIDPIGLGQNVAAFMQLADEDERLISSRAWTETRHIEKELTDLTEHMGNIIQKYLRDQYKNIDEYNAVAGEIAEPYRILVVIGFPVNFSTESARLLVSIATNGPRCGVSTLIFMDTEQARPPKFTITELERSASTIVWNGHDFVWKQKDIGKSQLLLDTIPSPKIFHTLLKKIGKESQRVRQKVEIPFRRMIEQFIPEFSWWDSARNTREEINVPLGPSGATKYQYVRLGQGTAHHVLVAGKTGSGKTNLLHVFIIALCLSYHPDELELYLIDFKTVGFMPFALYKLAHARVIAVQSERQFGLSVLQGLETELEERKKLFSKTGVQNITQYRNIQPGKRMPRIVLLVDEFQEFFAREDEIAQEAATLLDRLVRTGRAFGIHVLLGSQTLAGAFTIARSTISQMAVRIAMQCEEADSRQILNDDNPAARLLSRPGEAIYNADNGAVGGNNLFQCVRLPDEEIQLYLNAIQQLANQQKYIPPWTQIIFEGAKKANVNDNQMLTQTLKAPTWSSSSQSNTLWLGEPIKIREPVSFPLYHRPGNNVLIVGAQEEVAKALLTIALFSLAAQLSPDDTTFYVLDFTSADATYSGILELLGDLPHSIKAIKNRRFLSSIITQIYDELENRIEDDSDWKPSIYLFIYGLQRVHELRIEDNLYGNSAATLSKNFSHILQSGPERGIHTLAWCDTPGNINQILDRRMLHEFETRIAFQMASEDSKQLMDSTEADALGSHRALLFREDRGLREKFIPYDTPSLEWLKKAIQSIQEKDSKMGKNSDQIWLNASS